MDLSNLFRIQERHRKERNLIPERLEEMETINPNQNYHRTVKKKFTPLSLKPYKNI